jgi:IS5 family transposase
MCGDERAVYADKAYEKLERRAKLKARGVKDRIQCRRHKFLKALPHWQGAAQQADRRRSRRDRARLRRSQSQIRVRPMRYAGLAANALHLDLTLIAFNLRTAASKCP